MIRNWDDGVTLNNYIVVEFPSITDLERAHVNIFGGVVVLDFAFNVSQVIPYNDSNKTALFFSGFPKAKFREQRFRIPHMNPGETILDLGIDYEGKIYNQWTAGDIAAGKYQGQAVYIADTSDTRYF